MTATTDSHLTDPTEAWQRRVEAAAQNPAAGWRERLDLVRQGIVLRRQWDLADRHSPRRRELLQCLATAQTLCHQALIRVAAEEGPEKRALEDELVRQARDDDLWLAGLLADLDRPADAAAFALECFRDDLHWLSTQAAVLDGAPQTDFLGRVLIEQEALQRELGQGNGPESSSATGPECPSPDDERLRAAAARLRGLALARQAEAFLGQPDPADCRGWYRTWQSASRLSARLIAQGPAVPVGTAGAGLGGGLSGETIEAVARRRARAVVEWKRHLEQLPADESRELLRQVVEDLADRAGESLTFLEEQTLSAAVRNLEILREDTQTCLDVLAGRGESQTRPLRRTLRRRQKAIEAELQERRLAWRMEGLFGRRAVAAIERFMLFLLVLFMILLAVEGPLLRHEAARLGVAPGELTGGAVEAVLAWVDLVVCAAFLGEFGLKMALAEGRWLYLRRNWLTGLLPAIPFGFLAYATHHVALAVEGEWLVLVRVLRYLRLSRVAQWLRVARPVLRMARLVGFLLWASDRMVRRLSPLLNRSVVLFGRASLEEVNTPRRAALAGLRARFFERASEAAEALGPSARCAIVEARIGDLTAMLDAPGVAATFVPEAATNGLNREIPLEDVVVELLSATPASVAERVGRSLALSIARWCRAFDVLGVRRLPVVRDLVAAGRLASPYETTAQAANRLGLLLQRMLERIYWFADLYGTVTAPQLVDSIGEWMIKGTAPPARRFLLWGTLFLVFSYLVGHLPHPALLDYVAEFAGRILGTPLVVLGTLCLVPLVIGLWFRQIASEATDFYTKVAEAQFLAATKNARRRLASAWRAMVHRRVLAPEAELAGCAPSPERLEPLRQTVERLFDDYLDGAPFHRSDTRLTTQLLGNLDLLTLYHARLRYGRRQLKRLRRLDLSAARGSLRGPYLWFHFISRSLAQQTAKLVVDYNAFAIPLDRLATANDEQIRDYVAWLGRRARCPIDPQSLPPAVRERLGALPPGPPAAPGAKAGRRAGFQGSDFTALHFLSTDAELVGEVRRRYGDLVADLVCRDRRDNVRRVFRAYPLHRRPKEQRTFNPLSFYQRHLAGGWVLLFPAKVLWWLSVLAFRAVRLVASGVREVLHPRAADVPALDDADPLSVAIRKIHRMRKPLFMECLAMRAEFDPEYLGALLPGSPGLQGGAVPIEDDLELIGAGPRERRHFARLAAQRRRQVLDFRYWLRRLELDERGLEGREFAGAPATKRPEMPSGAAPDVEAPSRSPEVAPESLRAMALAFVVDDQGARTALEATRLLERAFEVAPADRSTAPGPTPRWEPIGRRLGAVARRCLGPLVHPLLWRRQRFARLVDRLFQQPAFAAIEPGRREECCRLAWRQTALRRAARRLAGKRAPPDPVASARAVLEAAGRDPATWTRQLVVLRAVQTLSVLDLRAYCDLVAELGDYAS
ncbi:MAG: ion transporter [Thermoguttaceae bacterium]|nr:ion transporter [Thermoguttaceae bacterium]